VAECGDGVVNETAGELCEDGDNDNFDGCPDGEGGTCVPARCGDGHLNDADGGTEGCDDGDNDNSDECPDGEGGTCQPAICGDGFIHTQANGGIEQCDGDNLGGADCQSVGAGTGALGCTSCSFDVSGCVTMDSGVDGGADSGQQDAAADDAGTDDAGV
jgi:hypothetical protein